MFNFEVENMHTYYVGEQGVLVHNDCSKAADAADDAVDDIMGSADDVVDDVIQETIEGSKNIDLDNLPDGWTKTTNNGFTHVRDGNGNIRIRIDPSDAKTAYQHMHLYDELGNSLDEFGNIVSSKSSAAHIPLD